MRFDHNAHYHRLLLRHIPATARRVCDVGCGTGEFAEALAARGLSVDATDRDPAVLAHARAHGSGRVRWHAAADLPGHDYDAVFSLASLHHLPPESLPQLHAALAPGGTLVVLGCYATNPARDWPWELAAIPANALCRLACSIRPAPHPIPPRPPVTEPTSTLDEVRGQAAALLPGSDVRRLLFWRYLLTHRRSE